MNYFPSNLKYLSKRLKITQHDLAIQLDVNQSSISNWINNLSQPDIKILMKVRELFGIDIDTLILCDLADGNLITDEQVENFRVNGNLNGNLSGNLNVKNQPDFREKQPGKGAAEAADPVILYTISSYFKILSDKIDNLTVIAEKAAGKKP